MNSQDVHEANLSAACYLRGMTAEFYDCRTGRGAEFRLGRPDDRFDHCLNAYRVEDGDRLDGVFSLHAINNEPALAEIERRLMAATSGHAEVSYIVTAELG